MKVAILTRIAQESSQQLADALKRNGIQARVIRWGDQAKIGEHIFSYGFSDPSRLFSPRLNTPDAIRRCVDKAATLRCLQKAGIPCIPFTTDRSKALKMPWEWVVVRESVGGRKAEGFQVVENGPDLPHGEFYSEWFDHKREYRIVVFRDEVVGRYLKDLDGDGWHQFKNQPSRGFATMDDACIKAAKALGIDYVGFDVVSNTKKDFRILEANSAAILTDEAETAIVEYYLNLES